MGRMQQTLSRSAGYETDIATQCGNEMEPCCMSSYDERRSGWDARALELHKSFGLLRMPTCG